MFYHTIVVLHYLCLILFYGASERAREYKNLYFATRCLNFNRKRAGAIKPHKTLKRRLNARKTAKTAK